MNKDQLMKELKRLQRQLNSHRLSVWIEGHTRDPAIIQEREVKLKRFYEVLNILRS